MPKTAISIFFSIVFALLICAQTVISVVEKTFDVSVFFSVNEEENKENESSKTFELEFAEFQNESTSFFFSNKGKKASYYLKNYEQFDLESISPPPELI